jgi:predicted TIM-barrel fold metal-dependent hydrolase
MDRSMIERLDADERYFETHPVSAEGLLAEMDATGVVGAVAVQTKGAYGFDNSYLVDALRVDPHRLAGVSIIDLESPSRDDALKSLAAEGVLGVRLFHMAQARTPWLVDDSLAEFMELAAELNVRLIACVRPQDVHGVANLARLADPLPIALDHCGFIDLSDAPAFEMAADLLALADCPNVYLKVTNDTFKLVQSEGKDVRPMMRHLKNVFGAERMMWGSDYPPQHRTGYAGLVVMARYACSDFNSEEQRAFLSDTALSVWPELRPDAAAIPASED